jgi:hypothetical protein
MTKQTAQNVMLRNVANQLNNGNKEAAAVICQYIAGRMVEGHPHPRWASYPLAERYYAKLSKAGKLTY